MMPSPAWRCRTLLVFAVLLVFAAPLDAQPPPADSVDILSLVPVPPASIDGIPRPGPGDSLPPPTTSNRVTVEVSYTTTYAGSEVQASPRSISPAISLAPPASTLPPCSALAVGSGRCAAAFIFLCDAASPPTSTTTGIRVNLVHGTATPVATDTTDTGSYTFTCPEVAGGPDLVVAVSGPTTLTPGVALGPGTSLDASNVGGGPAAGTVGSLDPPNGYMIDLVLSADTTVPPGFATYSATWHEDVLLLGGRASNTTDLAAGARAVYPHDSVSIPADTPAGDYYLCGRIDPADEIAETDETNNVSCVGVTVVAGSMLSGRLLLWIALAALGAALVVWLVRRRTA